MKPNSHLDPTPWRYEIASTDALRHQRIFPPLSATQWTHYQSAQLTNAYRPSLDQSAWYPSKYAAPDRWLSRHSLLEPFQWRLLAAKLLGLVVGLFLIALMVRLLLAVWHG